MRVVNSEAGTAARIRVVIESADSHQVWGTVGVSENIIEASWMALVDAFEYKLHREELGPAATANVHAMATKTARTRSIAESGGSAEGIPSERGSCKDTVLQ